MVGNGSRAHAKKYSAHGLSYGLRMSSELKTGSSTRFRHVKVRKSKAVVEDRSTFTGTKVINDENALAYILYFCDGLVVWHVTHIVKLVVVGGWWGLHPKATLRLRDKSPRKQDSDQSSRAKPEVLSSRTSYRKF